MARPRGLGPPGMIPADAQPFMLLARLDMPPPAEGGWLSADAAWVGLIAPSLARSGLELDHAGLLLVRVAAVHPVAQRSPDGAMPPADFEISLIDRVADAIAACRSPGLQRPQVLVHEEWRPVADGVIEIALYGQPTTGAVGQAK